MAESNSLKLMAICESCYLSDHTRWAPESMDEAGHVLMSLVDVDVPIKINTGTVETCCYCGTITIAGIFEMVHPSDALFGEDDEPENNFEMSLGDSDEGF